MFFYLTNFVLDVAFGSIYWVLKKTSNGIYYLTYGSGDQQMIQISKDEYEKLLLQKDINMLLKEKIQLLKGQDGDDGKKKNMVS